ncbi:MAG: ribosomal RNA small subunit methyltransferase A [Planctomycetaceae bacterium]|nr:ribosomal RNA small subunit methyltransferase A [Planctomycetaceae bacterium]
MSSKNQTVSFLRGRFREVGFRPYAKHGQNFLIDLNLLDLLVRVADVNSSDVVLEVGAGTGSLTARLAERAAAVVTVEIDPHLAQLALEQLEDADNVTLLQQDALRNKNNLSPILIETLQKKMAETGQTDFKLVANLPYSVATPIISNLLNCEITPSSMTVTIQKELGERIVATPRTKDYSSLSVWIQSQCYAAIVRELAPSVFWPRPKVDSAIVQLVIDRLKRSQISDLGGFNQFIRGVFLHRRKFLRSALVSSQKQLSKSDVDQIMQQLGFTAETRAEELLVEQLLKLWEAVANFPNDLAAD